MVEGENQQIVLIPLQLTLWHVDAHIHTETPNTLFF